MAIDKKLIHFGKLADFETQLNAGNILNRSIVFIQDAKKIWTHGAYYDCGGGSSAELEKYDTDKSWSIVVSNIQELDEEHGNAPDGTKAIVVTEANSLYGVNLFDWLMGGVDGIVDVVSNPFAYTMEISAIDTNVELPVSITSDVRVEVPFNHKIYIDMGADMASIYQISVRAGYTESVWRDGNWLSGTSYMIGNKMPLSRFLNLDDNAIAGLIAIAPALIVDFVGTKTITEFVKNGDNWEIWSEGESVLDSKLNALSEQIAQSLPTKTSQLENDSNFITATDIAGKADTEDGEFVITKGFVDFDDKHFLLPYNNEDDITGEATLATLADISKASNVYTTDFTVGDIWDLSDSGGQKQIDMNALIAAIESNKIILIPSADESSVKGVTVASYAHMEDFIYLHFTDSGFNFYIDLLYTGSSITDNMISKEEVVTMTRVNDAIASAITTTLNTPV